MRTSKSIDLDDLPTTWAVTDLGDHLLRLANGLTATQATEPPGVPVSRIETISDGTINLAKVRYVRDLDEDKAARFLLQPGDLLFSHINSDLHLGKTAVYRGQRPLLHGMNLLLLRTNHNMLDPVYLHYLLNFYRMDGVFMAVAQHAINQSSLNQTKVRSLRVPAPGLPQQHRIVAEIEKQFSRLDEAVANLKRVQANLKRYKAAVLKAAVEGKLTEEWRKQHPDVEPADQLLERILAERRGAAAGEEQAGITTRASTKHVLAREPEEPDSPHLPNIPGSWAWARMEDLGDIQLGRQRSPKYHSGEHMRPYLRVQNVFEDKIDLDDVMEMNFPPSDFDKYRLEPGDVLLNEGQSPELLGRPAMYRGELPGACFTNTLIRFRAAPPLGPDFSLLVFRAYMRSGRFRREGTITTNIAHLSAGRFARIEFALPPLEEQAEIVRSAERHLSIVEALEKELVRGFKRADRLRQSILQKAFSGQLVPQDPADEPASVLLERLRAERAEVEAASRRLKPNPNQKSPARVSTLDAPQPKLTAEGGERRDAASTILAFMKPGLEYFRSDVVDALGLTVGQWNVGIRELKEAGAVVQRGERRGARYALAG